MMNAMKLIYILMKYCFSLCRFRDGATLSVLSEALDELRETLRGVRELNFTGESKDIIVYAAELLSPSK